ncbi:MAG: hypothetical protein JF601_00045 [Acidobacteria bacterium]|nr:hypothetical protein [Acidobacteriota bacterium]
MHLTPQAYAFLGLTAIVAGLVAVVVFAMLKFSLAARETRRQIRTGSSPENVVLSAALQEAVTRLKAQERATAARAEDLPDTLGPGDIVMRPRSARALVGPTTREQPLLDVIEECLTRGSAVVRRSVELPETGHGITHLGVTVSPLSDESGQLHGAICLFTDLTAVKDLEEQLRLKDSLATVGELTAGIAHEFRNGLATIQGYSKLLDLNALPPSYRAYVEGIRAETESLSQVVTNFLNFARPAQLTLTSVDLRGICERAAEEIRPDARALGGEVEVRGDFVVLEGDEVLLRQAFSNLLRNAFEACVGRPEPPQIVIQSEIDAAQKVSRIVVNDNGGGIAPALREKVFRPFFTMKRTGTGLGLALVQKIIVFHNGRIVAAGSPSGGASLQITLPVSG